MIPDLSVAWVIFFVLLLTVIVDRLILRPILRVIAAREEAIRSARMMAERASNDARAAAAEFEQKTSAARGEIYKQMDEMRRSAMADRAEIMARTRTEADAQVTVATQRLNDETEAARRKLEADADALGGVVAERILGRRVS